MCAHVDSLIGTLITQTQHYLTLIFSPGVGKMGAIPNDSDPVFKRYVARRAKMEERVADYEAKATQVEDERTIDMAYIMGVFLRYAFARAVKETVLGFLV